LCSIGEKTFSGAQVSVFQAKTHLKEIPQILVSMSEKTENILATFPNCGNPLKLEMETKRCNMCGEDKALDMFARNGKNLRSYCKQCRCVQEANRRKAHPEEFKEKDKMRYEANKEVIKDKNKKYRALNRDAICRQKKAYYEQNKEQIKEYHQQNKPHRNAWKKNKTLTDPAFRVKESLKTRIHDVLKNMKASKTNQLIGCSKNELLDWIENQFGVVYSWETYGEQWHIDHVVPIAFFDVTNANEQLLCFSWTNLRPLCANENLQKSNKIDEVAIMAHVQLLKTFPRYQADYENSWWRRLELRYGNNPQDDEDFESLLKWAIRNQDST
jgi:hypothetical protein